MRTPTLRQKHHHTYGYVALLEHVFHWKALSQFELEAVAVMQSQRRADLYTQSCICSSKGILCRNITLAAKKKKKRESALKRHLDYSCYETGSQLCSNIYTFTAKEHPNNPKTKNTEVQLCSNICTLAAEKQGVSSAATKLTLLQRFIHATSL